MKKAACVMLAAIKDDDYNFYYYRIYANISAEFLKTPIPESICGIPVSIESETADAILMALRKNRRALSIDGIVYTMVYAIICAPEYLGINENTSFLDVSRIFDRNKWFPIYVANKIKCINRHHTEEVIAYVMDEEYVVHKINAVYCFHCDRFIISSNMLRDFYKLGLHFRTIRFLLHNDYTADFNEQSWLSICGYKAGKHGLPQHERREILEYVIDEGLMSRHQIVDHLMGLISLREYRWDADFSDAIEDWNDDVGFVREYQNSRQRSIFGKLI